METIYLTTSNLETPPDPSTWWCFFGWFSSSWPPSFYRQLLAPPVVTLGFGWRAEPQPAGHSLPVGRCAPPSSGAAKTNRKTPNQNPRMENKSHQTPTSHQNHLAPLLAWTFQAAEHTSICFLPAQNSWVVSLPNGLSVHPVRIPWAKQQKTLGWRGFVMLSPKSTQRKSLIINHHVKPTERVMFFQSPRNFGEVHFHNPRDSNQPPHTSAAIAAARAASRESNTWVPRSQPSNTDGNKNTEMLNRRPSVGFFRPALSSGKTHTKTWAKSRELWRNAGKCFVIFFATTNAHTNPNNYADEIPKKNMFVVFPPKYWSFNDLWYIWLVVEFPTKSSHRFSHLGWWQRLDQSSCFLHARPKGDDYKEFRPEFF